MKHVEMLVTRIKECGVDVMEVSSYAHSPYGDDTARNTVKLPIDDVVPWIKAAQVSKGYAIALHSRVWKGENGFHLPMIDFSTNVLSDALKVGIELQEIGRAHV